MRPNLNYASDRRSSPDSAPAPADVQVQTVAIHQPNFCPRLKVLQKIVRADLWVILDDVQFVQREWQNRTRLRFLVQPQQEFWLTIPVRRCPSSRPLIQFVTICDQTYLETHLRRSLRHAYHRSTYWPWIADYLDQLFCVQSPMLADLCIWSTLACLDRLGIQKKSIRSSVLRSAGTKTAKLLQICRAVRAQTYVAGSGSQGYLDATEFRKAGMQLEWQHWVPPSAQSTHVSLHWRDVGFLDFLARHGPKMLREHILEWTCGGDNHAL